MQRPSSLSTDSNVEHQLCQKQQVMRSPVTIPPSITEEGENDLTEESDNQHQLVEHTSDVKDVMVTGLVGMFMHFGICRGALWRHGPL